jgi:hypothetical protein
LQGDLVTQTLLIEPGEYAVCHLDADEPLPHWLPSAPFWTATRAADELSIICPAAAVPPDTSHESGWRLLRMVGPFPFDVTGVLESVLEPLASAGIAILANSTFNTDYLLVKATSLPPAVVALRAAGHVVHES